MPDETPRTMTPDEVAELKAYMASLNKEHQPRLHAMPSWFNGFNIRSWRDIPRLIATVEALWAERRGLLDVDALSDMEIWDLCREHHGRDDRTAAASFRRACRRAARLSTSQTGGEK